MAWLILIVPISQQHKCIFIHIPKTGGTSIEFALDMLGQWQIEDRDAMFGMIGSKDLLALPLKTSFLQHLSWSELQTILDAEVLEEYLSFAWVRNPYDRFVSAFTKLDPHMLEVARNTGLHLNGLQFSDFVDAVEGFEHVHLRPQSDFIYGSDGQLQVDFVGRYEYFDLDFTDLCKWLNLTALLPHKNASQHSPYQEYYDARTLRKIQQRYASDFELLGYTK